MPAPQVVDFQGLPVAGKLYIKTHGCQMNEYDSARMADVLAASHGLDLTEDEAEADVILVNTCSIRERAQEKVYSQLGRWKALKRAKPELLIGVGGCVASQEGAALIDRAPQVDLVFGPQTLHRLPQMIEAVRARHQPQVDISFPEIEKFDHLPEPRVEGPSAFVSIMEGCSKYCSFCVVPYTRGEEVSRPFDDVIAEVATLAAKGVREVNLLGQNVNAWRDNSNRGLEKLIERLAAMPDLARIRYTTSHPNDMTQGLLEAHRDVPELMPFLHLPVQSGNDRVLKAMNRSHTADSYLRILDEVRAMRPDIALSGDFIVGFPGETDAEFEDTLKLVEQVGYAQCFSFKYSARPGTPAATMDGQIAPEVMDERLQRLQAALNASQLAFNQASLGKRCTVLVERKGRHEGQWLGKSPWLQSVHFTGEAAIGDLVEVELVEAGPNSLAARLV